MKTTSVEIDFNTLKKRKATQQTYDPEVYDDIDVAPSDNRYHEHWIIYFKYTSVSQYVAQTSFYKVLQLGKKLV